MTYHKIVILALLLVGCAAPERQVWEVHHVTVVETDAAEIQRVCNNGSALGCMTREGFNLKTIYIDHDECARSVFCHELKHAGGWRH